MSRPWTDVEERLTRIVGCSPNLSQHFAHMPVPYRNLLAPLLQPDVVFPAVLRQLFTPRLRWPFTREAFAVATVLAHALCDLIELLVQPSDWVNHFFRCRKNGYDPLRFLPPATLLDAVIRIAHTGSERAIVTLVASEAASRLREATPAVVAEARFYAGPFWLLGFSEPFLANIFRCSIARGVRGRYGASFSFN